MRNTRNQPFCWQEKKVLRILRKSFIGTELMKLRNLYLTITEIDSDFNNREVKYYTKTIHTYSGLSKEWIPSGLKILESLKIIQFKDQRQSGKYAGRMLIFTPERIQEIPQKTSIGGSGIGEPVSGKTDTLEDSLLLEDGKIKENNVQTDSVIDYFNKVTGKKIRYSKSTRSHINARLNEGYNVEECMKVIDIKHNEWKDNEKMEPYIRIRTLFSTKFEEYLNQEIKSRNNISGTLERLQSTGAYK